MALSQGFYKKPKGTQAQNLDDTILFGNYEDQDFENAEYLQEVPYTSSSVDRSSIGSIPWADDAIKLNQLEWEKIEKMLAGLEALPEDQELRHEISDWQKKFPQILGQSISRSMTTKNKYTLSMESVNTASEKEELEIENKVQDPLSNRRTGIDKLFVTSTSPTRKFAEEENANICQMMQDITLKSVPSKLNRRTNTKISKRSSTSSSSSSYTLRSPPTPVIVPTAHPTVHRLRMPPIFNVLESTRRFRNLTGHSKNPSFVQLTQVQQPKSAVLANPRFRKEHKSAWHLPLAANRFFNNRNSILLPAISSGQVVHQYTTEARPTKSTTSEFDTTTSNSGKNAFTSHTDKYATQMNYLAAKRNVYTGVFSSTDSTVLANTSNSGRSISAAIQYKSTTGFNALHLPYSASKFHAFK